MMFCRKPIFRLSHSVACCLLLGLIAPAADAAADKSSSISSDWISRAVSRHVSRAVMDLGTISEQLVDLKVNSTAARRVIEQVASERSWGRTFLLIDKKGVVRGTIPKSDSPIVGQSIEDKDYWQQLVSTRGPVMGGSKAKLILFPLEGKSGTWRGAIGLSFKPETLMSTLLTKRLKAYDGFVEAVDADGGIHFTSEVRGKTAKKSMSSLYDKRRISKFDLFKQLTSKGAGSGTYTDFAKNGYDLATRHVEWTRCEIMGNAWIIRTDVEKDFQPDPENPLSGRWAGAFSMKRYGISPDRRDFVERNSSQQMSVLLMQDGPAFRFKSYSIDWQFDITGLVANNIMSALGIVSPSSKVPLSWMLHGQYHPEHDSIKGDLFGHGKDQFVKKSYFLRRVPPLQQTASK